jgi:hypothetical protein
MPKDGKKENAEKQELASLDSILDILKNKKKLMWLNFKSGFVRGFAGVFGAAVAILIIGLMVTYLGGIPFVGGFIKQIGDAVKAAK